MKLAYINKKEPEAKPKLLELNYKKESKLSWERHYERLIRQGANEKDYRAAVEKGLKYFNS